MSWALFKADVKMNRFIWALMLGLYLMYVLIMISMFDPESVASLNDMMAMMPKELIDAMGFTFGTTLLTFLSGSLYGILLYMFPLILSIVISNRLIAGMVDKGSMSCLLSTPNSRRKIAVTQAVFNLSAVAALFTAVTVAGIIGCEAAFPGQLEIGKFLLLNVNAILAYCAISGITFFFSCLFGDSSKSLGFGAGLPIAFVLMQMLGDSGEKMRWLGKLSLFTLFDPDRLFAGDTFAYIGMAVFAALAVILYTAGIWVFDKKDLPI